MVSPNRNLEENTVEKSDGEERSDRHNVPTNGNAARQRQINDYEQRACSSACPRASAIGAINSGLMRIGTELETALIDTMKEGQLKVDQIHELSEAFQVHLRYTRMIERYARLEHQFEIPMKKQNG